MHDTGMIRCPVHSQGDLYGNAKLIQTRHLSAMHVKSPARWQAFIYEIVKYAWRM